MKRAFGLGYIICDSDGLVQLHTLRSSRRESWFALIGKYSPERREYWKKQGFRCVFVIVEQSA